MRETAPDLVDNRDEIHAVLPELEADLECLDLAVPIAEHRKRTAQCDARIGASLEKTRILRRNVRQLEVSRPKINLDDRDHPRNHGFVRDCVFATATATASFLSSDFSG